MKRSRATGAGIGALLVIVAMATPALAQSDAQISEAVAERVIAVWGSQPSGIIVKANDGVVELWGEAPSQALADRAVQVAASIRGVREVVNHLDVGQSTAAAGSQQTAGRPQVQSPRLGVSASGEDQQAQAAPQQNATPAPQQQAATDGVDR